MGVPTYPHGRENREFLRGERRDPNDLYLKLLSLAFRRELEQRRSWWRGIAVCLDAATASLTLHANYITYQL